jgi:TatD DNase family protein
VHGWSGPPDRVSEAVSIGLYLSFGTRAGTRRARASAARVPLERILLESDCPSQPFPGDQRSQPSDLIRIAGLVAEGLGQDPTHLLHVTGDNARRLFAHDTT